MNYAGGSELDIEFRSTKRRTTPRVLRHDLPIDVEAVYRKLVALAW